MRQFSEVTYADTHKQHRSKGWGYFHLFIPLFPGRHAWFSSMEMRVPNLMKMGEMKFLVGSICKADQCFRMCLQTEGTCFIQHLKEFWLMIASFLFDRSSTKGERDRSKSRDKSVGREKSRI